MANDAVEGLVVSITGAGRGIGQGLALAFARRGAQLVVSDIDADKAQDTAARVRAEGARATALRVDVRSATDNAAQTEAAIREFGRLDVTICNAGIAQVKPLLDLEAADWDRMLGINVTGAFLTLQAAARQMLTQSPLTAGRPQGKILMLASIAGRPGAAGIAPLLAHYRASKAAVISLTQSAAAGLAPKVTVNAICPGVVDTDMWKLLDQGLTTLQGQPEGEAWKARTAGVPMGRPQYPSDVADLALFLASPGADYMTGQSINIDGGLVMS
jgi:NAD(P)-dependent dehydrogenase (short-subunit alcohol dehydrogenase family)